MDSRREGFRTVVIIISATTFGLVVWLTVLVVLWLILRYLDFSSSFWVMTESLSAAVAAAAIVGAGYVAYRELNELDVSRHMQVADRLFEELNSQENIDSRRWLFKNLPENTSEGIAKIAPEGKMHIKRVLNSLDRVAFLTQSGWIPEDIIMPWMNPMIVKSWVKLKPIVIYERERRVEPDYYQQAQKLADRCTKWRKENLPEAKITWVDDAL